MLRDLRRPLLAGAAVASVLGLAAVALPQAADALARYRAARWDDARAALAADAPATDPAATLLAALLTPRPDAALADLEEAIAAPGADPAVTAAARMDAAAIHLARREHRRVVTLLAPLVEREGEPAPGRALVLAGLARRALGDAEGAAEMLATVRPDDPSFAAARTALGDLAVAERDPAKALRYYGNADEDARAGAGRWLALRQEGREDAAADLRRELEQRAPGSLAVLEIHRRLRLEADEEAARLAQRPTRRDTAATATVPQPPAAGRYTLQLGAFSDRGLALELVRRYGGQVPDVRIDTERDERGQFLYKVRSGAYVSPARAREAANRLEETLGLDVFVAETGD